MAKVEITGFEARQLGVILGWAKKQGMTFIWGSYCPILGNWDIALGDVNSLKTGEYIYKTVTVHGKKVIESQR